MTFDSLQYAAFLPVVLLVYYMMAVRAQNVWLLIASYVFYGWWDYRFLLLILVSTVVDFFCGILIREQRSSFISKASLIASVCVNLGILFFFKYFNFFVDSTALALEAFGLHSSLPVLNIVLPVGISFYTFQTMSYSIDVYKQKIEPCRNPIDFALFVCYFPQLVAGPIERASHLLPAIQAPRRVDFKQFSEGLFLILLGWFKKVGVANALAFTVDGVLASPEEFSGLTLLVSSYLFAIQIYCDFSGYSDIARGTSKLIGINLIENFNQPYFSASITEFWRRWHISLSQWLRDYLYVPLGGNRCGPRRTYFNLLATMVLGGLWHGASWTFVIWGLIHGFALSFEKVCKVNPRSVISPAWRVVRSCLLFQYLTLTWIFFRAESFEAAMEILGRILSWAPGEYWIGTWETLRFGTLIALLLCIDVIQSRSGSHEGVLRMRPLFRRFFIVVLVLLTLVLGGLKDEVPFIYFQF